jgi:hypothetical protein
MNVDVEDLLRKGMERFTEQVPVPRGLAQRAARARRRRVAVRAAAGAGTATVTAAVVIAATVGAGAGGGAMQARTTAYVVSRVEKALAGQHLVLRGRTTGVWGPSISWAYGPRNRFEELTGSGEPYIAVGTALIGGKLTGVYVTYYNGKWSLLPESIPANACFKTGALEMAGPPVPASDWPAFIHATLACGAATVTGHVQIDGVETLKITGSPVTFKLPPGEARAVREKWARDRWTLYVNPKTYLPVRISGSGYTYGGPAPSTYTTSATDIQWLPPTAANIAKTLVTIPAGFRQVSSPADQ